MMDRTPRVNLIPTDIVEFFEFHFAFLFTSIIEDVAYNDGLEIDSSGQHDAYLN